MKNLAIFISLLLGVILQNARAQTPDSTENPKTKHEVSVSLNPVITMFEEGSSIPLYFSYKYRLNKVKLFASLNYSSSYNSSQNLIGNDQAYIEDTNLYVSNSFKSTDKASLRVGAELTKENKALEWTVGAGVLIGSHKYQTDEYYDHYYLTGEGTYSPYKGITIQEPNIYTDNYIAIGGSVHAGMNLKVTHRISTGLLLVTDLFYEHLMNSNKEHEPGNLVGIDYKLHIMLNIKI